jgi:glycosyltransferase involved in cell wall biosynthesis
VRILIASTYVPFVQPEDLAVHLRREMVARGHQAEAVRLPFHPDWQAYPEQLAALRLLDLSESSGNRIDRLITLCPPAHALRHPHKVAWLTHHRRDGYDLWGTPAGGVPDDAGGRRFRDLVRRSDGLYLRECRKVFATSRAVADRLRQFNRIEPAGVFYPPPPTALRAGPFGDHLLAVGRPSLAVAALERAAPEVRLVIAAADERVQDDAVRRLAADGRVRLAGWVSEGERAEVLAGCCGVLLLGQDEDTAGAALEAFAAHKPVLAVSDGCGSPEVVRDGVTGLVCPPTAEAVGAGMTRLWRDRVEGQRLGREGHATLAQTGTNWDAVIRGLLS